MEALYSKLYSKYSKLKKEKDSEVDKLNHDQEVKFVKYVEAAEEMIDYLRNENDRLREQVNELKNEMASIRSANDEQYVLYHKLLMEENQKNKTLSEEIDRLKNLQQEGLSCHGSDDKGRSKQLNTPGCSQAEPEASNSLSTEMTRKRSRKSMHVAEDTVNPCALEELDQATENESAIVVKKTKIHDISANICQPTCCKRKVDTSGGDANTGLFNCIFQDLVECVVGMKLSTVSQNEELCVSAVHQSSGYSFCLTWINNSHGEPELQYRVISLGTFERVAPEWMREVLIFSSGMCPVFFERVSRIIKLNH